MKGKRRDVRILFMMLCITMLLLSTVTYAWFTERNTPKVNNLELTTGTSGSLLVADDTGNGPGKYDNVLDLMQAVGADTMSKAVLNPVTTNDGVSFYSPIYKGNTVTGVKKITDVNKLTSVYVYVKSFYLKAGPDPKFGKSDKITTTDKVYDVFLAGHDNLSQTEGTYVTATKNQTINAGDTAANSMRISFEFEDGTIIIYEPNADAFNVDDKRAVDNVKNQYGTYVTLKQSQNGKFIGSPNDLDSPVLFTIKEGEDLKVTMRIWIEGTDLDCTNSIALDEIMARFQFAATDQILK